MMNEQEFIRLNRPYAQKIIRSVDRLHLIGMLQVMYNEAQPDWKENIARIRTIVQVHRDGNVISKRFTSKIIFC